MKENQAPTTSWESRKLPELIKENPALVGRYTTLVKRYNLLEKGVVTQEELDYLMEQSIWEPLNRRALTTKWKVLKTQKPNLKMVDLMDI